MKKLFVVILLLVLGACSNGKEAGGTEKSTRETVVNKEKELKFVVAPQYEGQTSDLIELGKKLDQKSTQKNSD